MSTPSPGSISDDNSSQDIGDLSSFPTDYLHCFDCATTFTSRKNFEVHLLTHIKQPVIPVQRLKRAFYLSILNKTAYKGPVRAVARKRSAPSYIEPKLKSNKSCLKLTLKRARDSASSEKTFKVVNRKILIGPGGYFSANGEILDNLKTEESETVENSTEKLGGSDISEITVAEDSLSPKLEETVTEEEHSPLDTCIAADNDSGPDEGLDSNNAELENTESSDIAILPDKPSDFEQSSNMIEVHGAGMTNVQSPAFPSTSPAPPGSDMSIPSPNNSNNQQSTSEIQNLQSGENETNSLNNTECSSSFNWGEIVNTGVHDGSASGNLEQRDHLLLPQQANQNQVSQIGLDSGDDTGPLDGGNSLLRGFLIDQPEKNTAVPVTNVGSFEGLGLGSEYMSLERLGETYYCEVCGERFADPVVLEDHRAQASHYKCLQPDCGLLFLTSDELMTHHQALHIGVPYNPPSMVNHQGGPVQQLTEQVENLPIPQIPNQLYSPVQPTNQTQYIPSARRPPPLYRVPTPPNNSQGHYSTSPQPVSYPQSYQNYPQGTQQSPITTQTQVETTPTRPFTIQPSQATVPTPRSNAVQGRTAIRPQGTLTVKRNLLASNQPSSSKQRRMDVLLPDPLDDADCHVIAMQKRTDSGPVINNIQGNASRAEQSMIQFPESISLSVRQASGGSVTVSPAKKSDANAVANILATRGITVTPAGGVPQEPRRNQAQPTTPPRRQTPTAVQSATTLNLNSSISIIPTAGARRQASQGGFAVPQGRSPNRQHIQQVERPPRPPTVDLTGDGPPAPTTSFRGRGRGRGGAFTPTRYTCQICDKQFASQESLNQHTQLQHRSPGKLPYKCTLCSAQYPSQQGLLQHRQTYHKEQIGTELAIPVVDMKVPGTLARLSNLGIRHYIPLSQLSSQGNNCYGLPIVMTDNNGRALSSANIGSSTVFSLGPLKNVPR